MNKPRVFISYGPEEKEWAQALSRALTERSVFVWIDSKRIEPGQEWRRALIEGLKDSDVYAVIIGRRTLSSPNVMFELGAASASGRPVIPIILGSGPSPDLIKTLADIHQIHTDDVQKAADELTSLINNFERRP